MGIAELITMAMEKEGLPKEQCLKKIWMVDSKGLIVKVLKKILQSMFFTLSTLLLTRISSKILLCFFLYYYLLFVI